jgi:hypothetical protein
MSNPTVLALLRELDELEGRLYAADTPARLREYLLARADIALRYLDLLDQRDYRAEQDADDTSRRLLDHDRTHTSHQGPVHAHDARWDADPRGYTRQEVTAKNGQHDA